MLEGELSGRLAVAVPERRVGSGLHQKPGYLGMALPGGLMQRAGPVVDNVRQRRVARELAADELEEAPVRRCTDAERSWRAAERTVPRAGVSAGLFHQVDHCGHAAEVRPVQRR